MTETHQISDKARNIFILVFGLCLCWFMYDRLTVIYNSDQKTATILKCNTSWTKQRVGSSTSSTTYRDVVVGAPVAYTEEGETAIGTVKVPKERCKKMIGTEVKVYIHKTDPSLSRINSFLQFWLFPSVFAFVIFAILFNPSRPRTGVFIAMLLFSAGGYLIAAELNYKGLGKNASLENPDLSPSENALNQCIERRLLEGNIQNRTDIKYLLCQSEKITDLSFIRDLVNLEKLYLQGNSLTSLDSFGPFPKLRVLAVAGGKTLKSTAGIERAPMLEEFQANKSSFEDLSGMEQLSNLKIIGLMMNNISDISPLAPLQNLEDVVLSYNPIQDISALANKPKLRVVQVYSSKVSDISPLFSNTALEAGGVSSDVGYPCEQILHLKTLIKAGSRFHVPDECK